MNIVIEVKGKVLKEKVKIKSYRLAILKYVVSNVNYLNVAWTNHQLLYSYDDTLIRRYKTKISLFRLKQDLNNTLFNEKKFNHAND